MGIHVYMSFFTLVEHYPMHIEVDSHTHTVASGHADNTLEENAEAATARSIKLLALTDHGPAMPGAPHLWYFLNMGVNILDNACRWYSAGN